MKGEIMAKNKWSWSAEKRGMERSFYFITNKKTKIIDILPPDDSLGYTSKDQTIHLAYEHPVMEGLSDAEKVVFRKGVFCHETLHQVFTDFNALEKALFRLSGPERRILSMISNILEDPAIEYWAPSVVSGPLLKALRFSISHIYKGSRNVEDSETPFGQYIAALIQFGDMGLLKGRFTFPEAKKIFAETADIFEKGVTEPIAAKRIEYAKEIFEISRPLWEEEVALEKAMQELAELLSDLGKTPTSGSGRGQDGDPSSISDTKKDRRRKITIKKVSKEEMEELNKDDGSGSGPIPEDADLTIYVCDEDEGNAGEENKNGKTINVPLPSNGNENKSEDSDGDSSTGESDQKEEGENTVDEPDGESGEKNDATSSSDANEGKSEDNEGKLEDNEDDSSSSSSEPNESDENEEKSSPDYSKDTPFRPNHSSSIAPKPSSPTSESLDEEGEAVIDEEEYRITEDDIAAILSEVERDDEELKKETRDDIDDSDIPDYDVSSGKMPEKSCLNYRVTFDETHRQALTEAYTKTVSKMSTGIHTTTKSLKRIFADDTEEREYRSSGQICINRLYSGTVTDRLFEKKISPAEKSDLVVEILVDESGSMYSDGKYIAARECCIALAEIFKSLNIPLYVLGFTADTMGYDIVHSHYITWKNTKDDRLKLLNIAARSDNCDGATIRYGTEIIKKKQAKNKLLIVISDGRPAALNYPMGDEDTKDAIRKAKKQTSVLGVAIGNNDTEKIQYFYEKDFLHISNVNELFAGITKAIKKIIKSW